MTEQIFISYSKKDSQFAYKLADDLEAAGFKIWIDRSITGGEQWREAIEKNLKAAGDVVIVVSPNSMASEWVKHEGSLAYGWGKRLFPILIDPVPSLPPWLEEFQWIDFVRKPYQTALEALIATLTPPNPIQDLLSQQVQAYQQTGELIGEAILRVIEENREKLLVDDQAQELIDKSKQAISARQEFERQLIEERETARQSEFKKALQLANTQRQRAIVLFLGLIVAVVLSGLSLFLYGQSNQNLSAAYVANTQSAANAAAAQTANTLAVEQRDEAQRQANIAHSRELASKAASLINTHLGLSLLLGTEALGYSETSQAESVLLTAFQTSPYLDQFLYGNFQTVNTPFSTLPEVSSIVAFSPDGEILASGGCSEYYDNGDISNNYVCLQGEIVLWDVKTREPLSRISAQGGLVSALAFSPDGKMLASGCGYNFSAMCLGEIVLWDISDPARPVQLGSPLFNDTDHSRVSALHIVFSPDGSLLAVSGPEANFIELWEVSDRKLELVIPDAQSVSEIKDLAFSPDGSSIAMGRCAKFDLERGNCVQGEITFWDVIAGQPSDLRFLGHPDYVQSLAFSPDGKTLASGSCAARLGEDCAKGEILLWDLQSREAIPTLSAMQEHSDAVSNLVFSTDGKELISGSKDNSIIVWEVEPKIYLGQSPGEEIQRSPKRSKLVQGDISGTILSSTSTGSPLALDGLALSPDGVTLAIGQRDGTVILWNLDDAGAGIRRRFGGGAGPISNDTIAFDRSGRFFVTINERNEITFWDTASMQPYGVSLSNAPGFTASIALSPDGKMLASGGNDGVIVLWDVSTREKIGQLREHAGWVNNLAFSPDGKILASTGMSENRVILWDVGSREKMGKLVENVDTWVEDIAFSPDGKLLAVSRNNDKSFTLWDVQAQSVLDELAGSDFIAKLAFSPDGKILAAGDFRDVILWDVEKREKIGEPLSGHAWFISGLAFSPDGAILASACQDSKIILWDIETHAELGNIFSRNDDWVHNMAFSPDGKYLAADYAYSSLALWEADSRSWSEAACRMAGRNFTQAEWQQYFPGEEYRLTCSQWPAGE